MTRLTTRGEYAVACAGTLALVAAMWAAAALGTFITGVPDAPQSSAGAGVGEEPAPAEVGPAPAPQSTAVVRLVPRASRSRSLTADPPAETGSHLNWRALRDCESSNNYNDRDSATYRGAYQFDASTWRSVGGSGDPADASPAEQDQRAGLLYQSRGRSPWPVCGRWL